MSDIIDRACALETQQRELAIAAARQQSEQAASYRHCQDCGEGIPAARRAAIPSCTRCIACQQEHEAWGWVR